MTDKNLIKAFRIIESNGGGWFKGEIPEETIIKAEKYYGITFPNSYREFLKEKGNGHFNGREFYGITTDKFDKGMVPNGIWLTMDERKTSGLDKSLVLIYQSMEYYYAIDTSKNVHGESPVIDLIPGTPKDEYEIIAHDFGSFFLKIIQEAS